MLERSAGYGLQQVDRDGLDVEIAECEGKFDPLFHSFTHADDASAAEVHPYPSCGMQGFQLLFLCMRGTERVEVGRSRFEVTVVPGHSGIIQCLQLFFVQQSERSAQPIDEWRRIRRAATQSSFMFLGEGLRPLVTNEKRLTPCASLYFACRRHSSALTRSYTSALVL